jgi:hypothetical protein
MYNSFLVFDFGSNEEAAQQARHKLEGWKQAFRLDKKLLYKFDRGADAIPAQPASTPHSSKPPKSESSGKGKSSGAGKGKSATKSKDAAAESAAGENTAPVQPTHAKLIVRLYFSGHEKMSHQRWLDRIPAEEPFKSAGPQVLKNGSPGFSELASQFDALD